ncbi:MAG TPA: MFS transporter [Microbacteriaceae bacterium]|nr:MFS transporter [Microbacteriaceae bacterium]
MTLPEARSGVASPVAPSSSFARTTFRIIGWLFCLELVSGILQGYYVPLVPQLVDHLGITDAEFNWFEAGQLLVSALSVPLLAKLGDMFGHKRMLLISTALTLVFTWWLVVAGDFTSFLVAWSFMGFYAVWLPLEVALIFDRGRSTGVGAATTRRAAGTLVLALQLGAIAGALLGRRVFSWTDESVPFTLAMPAIAVTLVFFAILFGVPESKPIPGRTLDWQGFVLLGLALVGVTAGLRFMSLNGPGAWWPWAIVAIGVLLLLPFGWWELRHRDPAIDLRVLRRRTMWPVQLTAGLVGISLLGAQVPLATFAATNPGEIVEGRALGYGLGLDDTSLVIGGYILSLAVGALLFAIFSKRISPRIVLIVATFLVAIGYFALIPLHDSLAVFLPPLIVAGLGCGALVAALPATAAAAAPLGQTGIAAALTNTTKTIGGSFASTVFGIVLAAGISSAATTAASLSGYLTVWAICGGGALVAAVLLFLVPKDAFGEPLNDRA